MSSGSDSESEGSLSSGQGSTSSSSSTAAAVTSSPFAAHREPVEVTKLRLQREQRLRRVLSQRHLGQPEPIPHAAFFGTRSALGEEDAVWLYALTNHRCFEALLQAVGDTTASLAGHLDAVLSRANPLFHFTLGMAVDAPVEETDSATAEQRTATAQTLRESSLMRRWAETTAPIQRKRPLAEEEEATTTRTGAASAARGGKDGASARKAARSATSTSATSGLVAQSLQAWETHLTDTLTKEGETVESFRQARTKSSYTEKMTFQQKAEWNEFVRETALQQQQRDREATRALRRGEVEER